MTVATVLQHSLGKDGTKYLKSVVVVNMSF